MHAATLQATGVVTRNLLLHVMAILEHGYDIWKARYCREAALFWKILTSAMVIDIRTESSRYEHQSRNLHARLSSSMQ